MDRHRKSPPSFVNIYFSGDVALPSNVTTVYHVPQYGKSTSVGANGAPLYTTSPVSTTQAFMFNTDERTVPYPGYTSVSEVNSKAPGIQLNSTCPRLQKRWRRDRSIGAKHIFPASPIV